MKRANEHHAPNPLTLLLALDGAERPTLGVISALALARSMKAELEVLRVVPEQPRSKQRSAGEADEAVRVRHALHRETSDWLREELGETARFLRVVIAEGAFVEQAAVRARYRCPELVLVSSAHRLDGGGVTSLARAARRPVLRLHGLSRHNAILAATDLGDGTFPVLRRAARLARQLRTPLVAFHNVPPMPARVPTPIPTPRPLLADASPELLAARQVQLAALGSQLAVPAKAVVRAETNAARAIVTAATANRAGLVVVGTHYRTWWRCMLRSSVAAEVSACCDRAVLVVPVETDVA